MRVPQTVSTRDMRMSFYELCHKIYLNNLQRQVGHGILAQFLGWISDPHLGTARRRHHITYNEQTVSCDLVIFPSNHSQVKNEKV